MKQFNKNQSLFLFTKLNCILRDLEIVNEMIRNNGVYNQGVVNRLSRMYSDTQIVYLYIDKYSIPPTPEQYIKLIDPVFVMEEQ